MSGHGKYPPALYGHPSQLPAGYPPPDKFDPSGEWYNPAGSLPFPGAKLAPKAYYFKNQTSLRFQAGTGWTGIAVKTAVISTPLFDLRPDLRSPMDDGQGVAAPAQGPSSVRDGVPIYRPAGGGQLYVQIEGQLGTGNNLTELMMLSREQAHPNMPGFVTPIQPDQDITDELSTAASSLLIFTPPGSGYNVRYWRVTIEFEVLVVKPDPVLRVSMGYY